MSESFSIYVIADDELPTDVLGLSDQEIYDQMIKAIESVGKLSTVVEMTGDDFVDALESVDKLLEGNRLLPICAMNNSPHEVLGANGECPYFGYFSLAQVQQLYYLFEAMNEDAQDTIESVETHGEVFESFREAVEEAVESEQAIAIVHG